jgi:hypothetical protein
MKNYQVYVYYHGCFSTIVEAEDEQKAKELAKSKADSMNDKDFLQAIELLEDGSDVYQV